MNTSAPGTLDVPPLWLRGPAVIVDGLIKLDTARAVEYQPMAEREILLDLAAVKDESSALAFVQRFGLLHCAPGTPAPRERLATMLDEARRAACVVLLYVAVNRATHGDDDEAAQGLTDLRGQLAPLLRAAFEQPAGSDDERLAQATKLVARMVSDGLADVRSAVTAALEWDIDGETPGPGDFRFVPRPADLLGYAYHQLAMAIVNRAPMRNCEECARAFVIADRRQRFCSPTCATRVRSRRFQARQRALRRKEDQ